MQRCACVEWVVLSKMNANNIIVLWNRRGRAISPPWSLKFNLLNVLFLWWYVKFIIQKLINSFWLKNSEQLINSFVLSCFLLYTHSYYVSFFNMKKIFLSHLLKSRVNSKSARVKAQSDTIRVNTIRTQSSITHTHRKKIIIK